MGYRWAALGLLSLAGLRAQAAPVDHRVVVLFVNVPGKKSLSSTRAQVAAALFTGEDSAAARYRRVSYGQVDFPGSAADVVGPFTVQDSGDFCETGYQRLADAADAAARASGVDLDRYDHVAYLIPPDMPCWWTGLGIIGGKRVWLKAGTARAFQHELGHNLGMNHALFWSSSKSEASDIMGTADYGLNAPHLAQLKWLDAFPGKVVEVPAARELALETIEADPNSSSLPKIAVVRPAAGANAYYLSYRKAVYGGGVNIHIFNGGGLDSGYTRLVRVLSDGESYSDGPLVVRQLSHVPGQSVSMRVDFNGSGQALAAGGPPAPAGTIQSLSSGKCLDVERGSKEEGAAVIQYDCHGGANQQWKLKPRGEGAYEFVNANSGKCLEARDGSAAAQAACGDDSDQLWIIEGQALKSAAGGLCLDLPHASAQNGVRPALWACHGGPNQRWRLSAAQ